MVIAYSYLDRGNLYLNITNRCSNACVFCMKRESYELDGHDLKLKREPSNEEILQEIRKSYDRQKEIVFCGLGEPLMRLNDVLQLSGQLAKEYNMPIRIDTNGHANLYPGRDVAKELYNSGVSAASISLNAETPEMYERLCRPSHENSYEAMRRFAEECSKYMKTTLTIVDLPMIDKDACRKIADDIGVEFLIRSYKGSLNLAGITRAFS